MADGATHPSGGPYQNDAFAISYRLGAILCVVCNGSGSAFSGRPAADLALHHVCRAFENRTDILLGIVNANRDARARQQAGSLLWAKIGATLDAVIFTDGHAEILHVGEGRVYRLRSGHLERLTDDHVLDTGAVKGIVTRMIGMLPEIEVDRHLVPTAAGDVFVICTNGLFDVLDDATIAAVLRQSPSAQALIDTAVAKQGRMIDIAVVVHTVGGVDSE